MPERLVENLVRCLIAGGVPAALLALRAGQARGVTRHLPLEQAETRLGGRLLLPAYFPDDLEWPPPEILCAGTPPAVCLGAAGGTWEELTLPEEGRLLLLRLEGRTERMLLLAASLRKARP